MAFRRLILLVVPIAVGFSLFSVWIVRDLLQQGEFTAHDSSMVGWLIIALMSMFVGASCGELLARGYYVLGDTKTPTWVGAAALVVGLLIKFLLFSMVGIWGIAIGVSAYSLISATTMAVLLTRRASKRVFAGCTLYLFQAMASTLAASGCCYLVYALDAGRTWVAAPVGAGSYLAGLWLMRNRDALQLLRAIRGRLLPGN